MYLRDCYNSDRGNFHSNDELLRNIEATLPPVFSRVEASRATGGLISAKTLSNEDALNKGPMKKVRVGSKIGYTREAFMEYLRNKFVSA